jgi:predicted DNA-binding transcriptional regulator AlpA
MSTQMDLATPAKRPQLLRVVDVAQLLNVKPRTIYEMVAQDRIPYRKPPG